MSVNPGRSRRRCRRSHGCRGRERRSGYQPVAGATTDASPTFVVALDPTDTGAVVHVGTSTGIDLSGASADEVGSCAPTLAITGATFACQPGCLRSTGTASLAAGAYYWWLTYTAPDPTGAPATHVSGPFPFTVSAPIRPAGVTLRSPADHAATSDTPSFTFSAPAGLSVALYVSDRADHLASGAARSTTVKSCSYVTAKANVFHCDITTGDRLLPGKTYYWWLSVASGGTIWVYGESLVQGASRPRRALRAVPSVLRPLRGKERQAGAALERGVLAVEDHRRAEDRRRRLLEHVRLAVHRRRQPGERLLDPRLLGSGDAALAQLRRGSATRSRC